MRTATVLIVTLALAALFAAPASADRALIEVSPVASLDGGPMFGGALSYPVATVDDYTLWLDLGEKRADAGNNLFVGASTDAWKFLDEVPVLKLVFPVLDFALPDKSRLMGAYIFDGEFMFALRVPVATFSW